MVSRFHDPLGDRRPSPDDPYAEPRRLGQLVQEHFPDFSASPGGEAAFSSNMDGPAGDRAPTNG